MKRIFISGPSGCGKTTTVARLQKVLKLKADQETLRNLINVYGFQPPTLVANAAIVDKLSPQLRNANLERLVRWQACQLHMHSQNASRGVVQDRCALDSLSYFLYDILHWELSRGFNITDSVSVIIDSAFDALTKPQDRSLALQGIETTVRGALETSLEWGVDQDIIPAIVYILYNYIELLIATPGVYAVLTFNPYIQPEEDGVRSTNNDAMSAIQWIMVRIADTMRSRLSRETHTVYIEPVEGRLADSSEDLKRRYEALLNCFDDSIKV